MQGINPPHFLNLTPGFAGLLINDFIPIWQSISCGCDGQSYGIEWISLLEFLVAFGLVLFLCSFSFVFPLWVLFFGSFLYLFF